MLKDGAQRYDIIRTTRLRSMYEGGVLRDENLTAPVVLKQTRGRATRLKQRTGFHNQRPTELSDVYE